MSQEKHNLVVITHSFFPAIGGVETFIDHFIGKLDKGRYNITIFTSNKNINTKDTTYKHQGINVHVIKSITIAGMVLPVSVAAMTKLIKHLRKAVIVHQHDIKFLSTFLYFFGFFFRYRLVLFSHGYVYHSKRFPYIKKLFLHYFSFLSKRYKLIVNISVLDYEIAKKYRFRNSVFIREAVDLSKFEKNIKQEQVGQFLYFGRISKNKGLENLFQCLSTLKGQSYGLTIVGNGEEDYTRQLIEQTRVLGIAEYISWKHEATDEQLLTEVSKAEVIFLPSIYEGFGISLLESIASRSKVMAHINEAYSDMLKQLDLAHYLFDFQQHGQFAQKLEMIRRLEGRVCEKLSLYDHDFMIKQVEEKC